MRKLLAIKAFRFSSPGPGLGRFFNAGLHDVPDAMAAHPWIAAGADGHATLRDAAQFTEPPPAAAPPPGGSASGAQGAAADSDDGDSDDAGETAGSNSAPPAAAAGSKRSK